MPLRPEASVTSFKSTVRSPRPMATLSNTFNSSYFPAVSHGQEVITEILEEDAHFRSYDVGIVLRYIYIVDENLTFLWLFD